jgi:hypothetical protein
MAHTTARHGHILGMPVTEAAANVPHQLSTDSGADCRIPAVDGKGQNVASRMTGHR